MTYKLRYYQQEAVDDSVEFLLNNKKKKKNGFLVEPTGSGKSIIIANIAIKLNDPVLCLQPSKELLEQNYKKYISYGFKASIYSASIGKKEIGDVTFATIGSIYKNPELFKNFRYAIIDECHKINPRKENKNKGVKASMYVSFFEELNIRVIGLTATPFRLKQYNYPYPHSKLNFLDRMRPKMFHEVIHVTDIKEMTKNKWWSPLDYIVEPFDSSQLKINSTGANYTDESIKQAIKTQKITDQAIYWAKKMKNQGRKQIIIFLSSIKEAEYVANKLNVDCISSKTKQKDREDILKKFESGANWSIVNVGVLSIGYDNQKIDVIIDCNPTLSLAMYYQKLGRGVRIDMSDNPTKKDCIVIDLAGNFELFGRIEDLEIDLVDNKWVVTSKNKHLTNTPIIKNKEDGDKAPDPELEVEIITFGKFKDEMFKDVPKWYWRYIVKTFKREEKTETLFKYIDSINL